LSVRMDKGEMGRDPATKKRIKINPYTQAILSSELHNDRVMAAS